MIAAIYEGGIMAVSQADIDNLNAAIASGTRSVTLGGQTVTYGTVDALIRARDDLKRQLEADTARITGERPVKRVYNYHSGRGYQ